MGYEIVRHEGEAFFIHVLEDGVFPGLSGFHLEFTNSDHHLNAIRVGEVTGDGSDLSTFLLGLSDGDGADPQRLWAQYIDLGNRTTFSITGRSGSPNTGQTNVSIPPIPADHLFVLRGFSLSNRRGVNHHLRRIAIFPVLRSNALRILFNDDSPEDDAFSCQVWFTYVPHARIAASSDRLKFNGYHSDVFEFTESVVRPKARSGDVLLSGFDFQFLDGDHHLRKLSIDPSNRNHFQIAFTDDERDNNVRCRLDYVIVEES